VGKFGAGGDENHERLPWRSPYLRYRAYVYADKMRLSHLALLQDRPNLSDRKRLTATELCENGATFALVQ